MEYLRRVLGIKVDYDESVQVHLPNYLITRYDVKRVLLDNQPVFFLYLKKDLEQMVAVKKHIRQIKKIESIPVVLVMQQMTFYRRESFIKEKIPFIVEDKQLYLPFMGIYLQERCDAEIIEKEKILPSSQMLLLYFIYQKAEKIIASQATKELKLTATSISRASKQLEQMQLIKTRKQGVQKIIFSELKPRELYETARKVMVSPVKRCVYIPKDMKPDHLLKSADLALAEYSMLNPPSVGVYATDSITKWNEVMTNHLLDADSQVAVELWRYDPMRLTSGAVVDPLSLALSLKNEEDERIKECIDEMLDTLWRKLDDSRN